MKRGIIAVVAVYMVWLATDYVIHQMILAQAYMDTAQFWRSPETMKMGLMIVVGVLAALAFVAVYVRLIDDKCLRKGLEYGCWFGFGVGVSMGYGMYSVMPIPYCMAFTWFISAWIQGVLAGLVVGLIVKPSVAAAE